MNLTLRSCAICLAAVCSIAAFGEPAPHQGLFAVVRNHGLNRLEELASKQELDGITFYTGMRVVAPRKGEYNFADIDRVLKTAAAHGKKVNLGILPGRWVPEWIYGEGVQKFEWTHDTNLVDPGRSRVASPYPWDPQLLKILSAMLREIGNRYTSDPALVSVQVIGPAMTNGLEANFNMTPEEAAQMGYAPEKLIDAWKQMFRATAEAFPNQRLSWCIHDMYPGKRDAVPGRAIRDWAYAQYGSRFHLLACYLTHENWFARGNQAVDIWGEKTPPIPAGLQLINIYSYQKHSPEVFRDALRRGLDNGADYLEIFAEDALHLAYSPVLAEIRKELAKKNAARQ